MISPFRQTSWTGRGAAARAAGRALGRKGMSLFLAAAGLTLAGCATQHSAATAEWQKPENVYRLSPYLPADVRRLAVLPISVERNDWQAEAGRAPIEAVLQEELSRVKKFELVIVTPEQLQLWTGQPAWLAEEKLPRMFLEKLREKLGCDGVLFSHLRPYHAFQPIVVGWNLKLVDVRRQEILWSADEVFDAGQTPVATQAREFEHGIWRTWFSPDSGTILLSPRQFSQFTLNSLLSTLPAR